MLLPAPPPTPASLAMFGWNCTVAVGMSNAPNSTPVWNRRHRAADLWQKLIAGHRILPLLSKHVLRYKIVDVRRQRSELTLIEKDRAGVLLAAKDQFRLALANRLLPPGRQR